MNANQIHLQRLLMATSRFHDDGSKLSLIKIEVHMSVIRRFSSINYYCSRLRILG